MQQRDTFAFVAGMSIGLGGGALGAFLTCTAARTATCRLLDQLDGLLDQLDEQYLKLSPSARKARVKVTSPETASRMISG